MRKKAVSKYSAASRAATVLGCMWTLEDDMMDTAYKVHCTRIKNKDAIQDKILRLRSKVADIAEAFEAITNELGS